MAKEKSKLEQVAQAIEAAEVGFKLNLTRLVDEVHTYELTYSTGERFEFDNTDDAYEHIGQTKRMRAARAAIEALRDPSGAMLDAAYAAAEAYDKAPAPNAWCGLSSAFRAMLDVVLKDGEHVG
jgi:uncharacterized sporulation protein YeaH/YhbH (DUF444 family)